MATLRGHAVNSGFSNKWVYGDWTGYDYVNDWFRTYLTVYSQYQHIRSSYQGAYSATFAMPYYLTNVFLDGGNYSFNSGAEYASISYLQYTGLKWGVGGIIVYLPRGTAAKTVTLYSNNPSQQYSFWNVACSGAFSTPAFDWSPPWAVVTPVYNTLGKAKININTYSYAGGAVPASFSSESLVCDTKSSPTTARTKNTDFNVEHNTKYYYKYLLTDNHNTTTTITNSFITLGEAPILNSVDITIGTTTTTLEADVSYDTNASLESIEVLYGTTGSYGNTSETGELTNLIPNTTYYYSIKITDNFDRVSNILEGSFTTYPEPVTIVNAQVTDVTFSSCRLTMVSSNEENTISSRYIIFNSDKTEAIKDNTFANPVDYDVVIDGLDANQTYIAFFTLQTKGSLEYSEPVEIVFTTKPLRDYVKVIYGDGTDSGFKKMYSITDKNYAILNNNGYTINGITLENDFSGSVIVSGTATDNFKLWLTRSNDVMNNPEDRIRILEKEVCYLSYDYLYGEYSLLPKILVNFRGDDSSHVLDFVTSSMDVSYEKAITNGYISGIALEFVGGETYVDCAIKPKVQLAKVIQRNKISIID